MSSRLADCARSCPNCGSPCPRSGPRICLCICSCLPRCSCLRRLSQPQTRVPHLRVVPFDAKVGISKVGPRSLPLAISTLVFTLCLLGSAAAASQPPQAQSDSRQAQALWLSQQLHCPVEAAQILVSPEAATLEGCAITHARLASTGATALSVRCPASRLPHLVLLTAAASPACDLHPHAPKPQLTNVESNRPAPTALAAASPNIVHAGAALRADWRTNFIHAQLPVVALDSGAAGAEIRVRIPQTNRIVRARILSPHTVAILMAGA